MNIFKYFSLLIFLSAIIQNYASGITNFEVEKISNSSGDCTLCEFVAKYVEGYLAENLTISQIDVLLDRFCTLGPDSFIPECQDFINTEVPVIIDEFENYETPEEVCTQMGFCSSFDC